MANDTSKFGGFGGPWSTIKLTVVSKYFDAYCTALSKTSFKLFYIDAFAGGGQVEAQPQAPDASAEAGTDLFAAQPAENGEDDASLLEEDREVQKYRHGSPLLALRANPGFHEFIFIERSAENLNQLREQVDASELRQGRRISYLQEDANAALQRIAGQNWRSRRAVVFLDPYALHLRWETLEAIARTEAMDVWMLFPAMAINRMLPRDGEVPDSWAKRLTEAFGEDTWRDAFYAAPEPPKADLFPDLLPDAREEKRNDPFGRLSRYVTRRLKEIFADAVDQPLVLKTEAGSPLFLLCFAVANKKGAPIAKKIANYIIQNKSHGH